MYVCTFAFFQNRTVRRRVPEAFLSPFGQLSCYEPFSLYVDLNTENGLHKSKQLNLPLPTLDHTTSTTYVTFSHVLPANLDSCVLQRPLVEQLGSTSALDHT